MKITNSFIPNKALASNPAENNSEKYKAVLAEIKNANNEVKEASDMLSLSDEAKQLLADVEAVI